MAGASEEQNRKGGDGGRGNDMKSRKQPANAKRFGEMKEVSQHNNSRQEENEQPLKALKAFCRNFRHGEKKDKSISFSLFFSFLFDIPKREGQSRAGDGELRAFKRNKTEGVAEVAGALMWRARAALPSLAPFNVYTKGWMSSLCLSKGSGKCFAPKYF